MSGDDGLRGNTADGNHSQAAIQQFRVHQVGYLVFGHGLASQKVFHTIVCKTSKNKSQYICIHPPRDTVERERVDLPPGVRNPLCEA